METSVLPFFPLTKTVFLVRLFLAVNFLSLALGSRAVASDRPNILWITAEDMSPTLGCYGDSFAHSPNLDALAKESVLYTHAMATSPVCSPSRSCLINGRIASSQGTHPMRSQFPIPASMRGFPSFLRQAGYYTTNNVKTDYNSANAKQIIAASWNESSDQAHWKGRESGQPFFAVFNLMTSHQSRTMVWPYQQFQSEVQSQLSANRIHDPAKVPLPPYYPDTPVIRKTVARYYDCVSVMDQQVGAILAELAKEGLDQDTIVFFYSDHGSGMPRHKRALLDSGMRVPMLIRFPEKYRRFAPADPGSKTNRLVCFEDFAPTVLNLAGLTIPDYMVGKPFLGDGSVGQRRYVFGHRDRVDEVIDMARSVRDHRFLYIRNYMPHLGYNQPSAWVDQSEMSPEIESIATSGSMSPAQWHYAGPTRPQEELYDCQEDPLNLNNLADSPDHHSTLERLRGTLRQEILSTRDLGFLPEVEQARVARDSVPMVWAQTDQYRLEDILAAASRVGTDDIDAFVDGLANSDPSIRYWSAVGLSATGQSTQASVAALKERMKQDPSIIVRIESANALARHDQLSAALPALAGYLEGDDTTVLLHAARTVEMLGADARPLVPDMKKLFARFETDPEDAAWFIRFTTSGFLKRVESPSK